MIRWLLQNGFVWGVRIGSLLVGCFSMQHILGDNLGYRVDTSTLLIAATIMIVVIRLWMPWAPSEPESQDDGCMK